MSLLTLNFSRPGTLGLTRRHWTQPPPWSSPTHTIRTIEVSLGLAPPLVIPVREFTPQDGDVLHRSWVGRDGVQKTEPLAPYAVADPLAAREYVEGYVAGNYADAVYPTGTGGEGVRRVHEEVGGYLGRLRGIGAEGVGFKLLDAYTKFWFGLQCTMRSAWLTGPQTLGMTPLQDPAYPLSGCVSVPRQVVETVGCILEEVVCANQRGFLGVLAGVLEGGVREAFYAAFLVVFGVLKGCGDISGDRYRYARENFKETRFDKPDYVKRLHANANVLLESWHGYARSLGVDWSSRDTAEASLAFLPAENRKVALLFYDTARDARPTLGEKAWRVDLWFCAQMTEKNWTPRGGYDEASDTGFDPAKENAAWGEERAKQSA